MTIKNRYQRYQIFTDYNVYIQKLDSKVNVQARQRSSL